MLNKILSKKIKFPLSLRGAKRRSNLNKGFSLLELMVAVVILAMAIFGIFHAYSVGFMGMADARDRTVATNYAREKMEEIKNKSFEDIGDESGYGYILIPEQTKFERKLTVTVDDSIDDLKKATTVVRWIDRNEQTKTVMLETLIYNND